MAEPKKFSAFARRPNGAITFKPSDWQAYWHGLTEAGRRSLEAKAEHEGRSLTAVAIEWGAIDEKEAR